MTGSDEALFGGSRFFADWWHLGRSSELVGTYFLTSSDWCDHVIFFSDHTCTRGALGGRGTWKLSKSSSAGFELDLAWNPSSERFILVSRDDAATLFQADGARLEHAGGLRLPETQEDGEPRCGKQGDGSRSLLFSSVGSQCLPVVLDHWLVDRSSLEFDVVLMQYAGGPEVRRELDVVANQVAGVHVHQKQGMKWPNFRHWIALQGGPAAVAARYDYVWVVDDDVRLATSEINRMFSILLEYPQIQFASPSFDARSTGVWRYFDRHDPRFRVRYTDFVECTAPVLHTRMLLDQNFDRVLQAVQTGCYIDFCFFPAAGSRQDAVAIIDAVQCHHPPRGADAPSEMRQVQAWEEHKNDDVHFEREGVPREWWWWRQPRFFAGVPAKRIETER